MKTALREGIDYYREGPYVVFTAHYLRERGYCCNSGCRHCPWKEEREGGPAKDEHAGGGSR